MAHESADVIGELLLQPELLFEREAVGVGGAGLLARGAAPRRQLDQPALQWRPTSNIRVRSQPMLRTSTKVGTHMIFQ